MSHKIVVIDDRDINTAQEKLAQGRKKYALYEWIRFSEDDYKTTEDAFKALCTFLRSIPMFYPGRIVYCFGSPFRKAEDNTRLSKQLSLMAENISLVIIARFDKLGSSLIKTIRTMVEEGTAKVDSPVEIDRKNVLEWIAAQAEVRELQMDRHACMVLADISCCNANRIQNELNKLQWAVSDKVITGQIILTVAFGEGEVEIINITNAILEKDMIKAHEYMQRLLDKGESTVMISSYFYDWVVRLALAEACGCNSEMVKLKVGSLMRWEGGEGVETIHHEKFGPFSRQIGKQVPMFANPNSFYYTCNDLREANRAKDWAFSLLDIAGKLQISIRMGKGDQTRLFHEFIEQAGEDKKEEVVVKPVVTIPTGFDKFLAEQR